jgi:hypothetical protein
LATFRERHAAAEDDVDDYTDDEYEAGLDEIATQFGIFATLDVLSGGDPIKYQQILDIDADTIMQKVHLMQMQSRVAKRLQAMRAARKP